MDATTERQMIAEASRTQIEARQASGDQLEVPRPVDHTAFFRRSAPADACATDLTARGFDVAVSRRLLRGSRLEFHRMDAVTPDAVAAFCEEIMDIVHAHGGSYDGWGGFLVTDTDSDHRA